MTIRKVLVEYGKLLALVDPNDLCTPSLDSLLIKGLSLLEGMSCDDCGYVCIMVKIFKGV